MKYISLEFTNIVNMFNISTIEQIFMKLGGLEKNSFNVATINYSDNSRTVVFIYPSDFTSTQAYKFIKEIYTQLKNIPLNELSELIYSSEKT